MTTITPILNTTSVAEAGIHLTLDPHDLDHVWGSDSSCDASQREVPALRLLSQTQTPIH